MNKFWEWMNNPMIEKGVTDCKWALIKRVDGMIKSITLSKQMLIGYMIEYLNEVDDTCDSIDNISFYLSDVMHDIDDLYANIKRTIEEL